MASFTYRIVASPLHDDDAVASITAGLRGRLVGLGGATAEPEDDTTVPFLVVVATGGTEAAVLDLVGRRRGALALAGHALHEIEPTTLVAHPWHNSLPAALEALARVQADGGRGRIVYVPDDRPDTELAEAITDVVAVHRLHRTRLGLVGEPSGWLVASVPDAGEVRRRWGVTLVPVPMADVLAHHGAADGGGAAVRWLGRVDRGGGPHAPAPSEVAAAAALEPTLTAVLDRHGVDAVTVRCFDFLTELQTSGCLALAALNDGGVVAGCEGDVAAAVAMLWVRHLLGTPSWIANPAQLDVEREELLLAHCTIAPSLTADLELHTHFESGIGVGLRGRLPDGPATLVRLGGRGLERCWLGEGELVGGGDAAELCRTQARVRLERGSTRDLLAAPLGNHLVLVPGRHADRLERWWRGTIA